MYLADKYTDSYIFREQELNLVKQAVYGIKGMFAPFGYVYRLTSSEIWIDIIIQTENRLTIINKMKKQELKTKADTQNMVRLA